MFDLLLDSTYETLIMVVLSTLVTIVAGIPLGVLLFSSSKGGLTQNLGMNRSVGFVVNVIRSIPYIILVVAIIPFTRLLVGSSIGTMAATVPLSIAGVMLYCRMVEDALRNVPNGLIEAAESMGASRSQIIKKVLLPEALPTLISGLTFVIISLIGFSAMAGTVGGGGLGDLGIRYGYQRYRVDVIIQVILILVVMVQIVQFSGDFLAKKLRK